MRRVGLSFIIVMFLICATFSMVPDYLDYKQLGKIAVVIFDNNPMGYEYRIDGLHKTVEILTSSGYVTYVVDAASDFQDWYANRVIIIYLGHGLNITTPHVFIDGSLYNFQPFIHQYIHANELILLNGACFAGSWLKLLQKNHLFIGVVNRTLSMAIGRLWSPYNLSEPITHLLITAYEHNLSIERAYDVWTEEIILTWFKHVSQTTIMAEWQDAITWHPVMYDGIEGEVML